MSKKRSTSATKLRRLERLFDHGHGELFPGALCRREQLKTIAPAQRRGAIVLSDRHRSQAGRIKPVVVRGGPGIPDHPGPLRTGLKTMAFFVRFCARGHPVGWPGPDLGVGGQKMTTALEKLQQKYGASERVRDADEKHQAPTTGTRPAIGKKVRRCPKGVPEAGYGAVMA